MILLSHPTGNANVRGALRAFDEVGLLAGYFTTLGFTPEQLARMPAGLARRLQRRSYILPEDKLSTRPLREALRLASKGRFVSVDAVYTDLDHHVARQIESGHIPGATRAVYAYEDGADATFTAAQNHGLHRIYEQPIGYWRAARRIQEEEAELQPAWAPSLDALRDASAKLDRKDRELSQAECVVAASTFTRETLNEYPGALSTVTVIPYGCIANDAPPEPPTPGKLRALFVGGLSQRKGLSYLFEAVTGMESALELTVVGRRPATPCPALDTALAKHRWIETLPNDEILALMRRSDVFIFPSLFEGFGLVLTEALSQGLPIIATPHTAAPDIITDGREGFIVPIRDATTIREKLELLADDTDRLAAMKEAAWQRSRELTWSRYAQRLVEAVKSAMEPKN